MIRFDYHTDAGIGTRANLGLILLQADEVIEPLTQQMFALDGVALYHSRMPSPTELTTASLMEMRNQISNAASLFPGTMKFAAIGFACTSASAVIGESVVEALVRKNHPEAQISNPLGATKAALRALKVRRLALVAPYTIEVVEGVCDTFENDGFDIATVGTFDQISESVVARIDESSIFDAIVRAGQAEPCEAVFISCTNLRAANVIEAAESTLGIPVISSNQALCWHMLRLANITDAIQGYGRLFKMAGKPT